MFLKRSGGAFLVMANPASKINYEKLPMVRFGMVTDPHFARTEILWERYYDQSAAKLADAVKTFNNGNLDFIIELGDLKDQGTPPDRQETMEFLIEIENVLSRYNGPVYHVLGNHDMDSISKEEFLKNIKNHGQAQAKKYYSFITNGIKFIVLDANYNEDGADYDSGNFDWTYCKIPEFQIEWLKNELNTNDLPVIVFTHQLLDSFSDVPETHFIDNAAEIRELLESSKKVLAVFQGHFHDGNYSFRNGIHYYTLKAMVEKSLPENNSFAIVEVDSDLNIKIEGFYNCEDFEMKCGSYQV
jgi:3',5'-cyclic AMP phosphodiesterase CpdA